MPELPEVETTRRGILPYLAGQRIRAADVRERRLRWPVPEDLERLVRDERINDVQRRGKYLLIRLAAGSLLVHLGMSGSLRVLAAPASPPRKHDHLDLLLESGHLLRFHDPRRFGAVLWITGDPALHPLLSGLGPEPLGEDFGGEYLFRLSRGRRAAVKQFLMDGHIVVGVGNIYANEALHMAGIHPLRQAGRIARTRYDGLAAAVREVLQGAIAQGGTTLRDYVNGDGAAGYFSQSLRAYGRTDQPCRSCGTPIRLIRQAQRSTFFCAQCQR